jgi:hypothetical protein
LNMRTVRPLSESSIDRTCAGFSPQWLHTRIGLGSKLEKTSFLNSSLMKGACPLRKTHKLQGEHWFHLIRLPGARPKPKASHRNDSFSGKLMSARPAIPPPRPPGVEHLRWPQCVRAEAISFETVGYGPSWTTRRTELDTEEKQEQKSDFWHFGIATTDHRRCGHDRRHSKAGCF